MNFLAFKLECSRFIKGSERSMAVKKNIAASFVLKCISILVSLQVVPLTISYVNSTQYGIWLTLSSIIAWLSYFDLGFAHGFRNRFAEAKAKGDIQLAREYVSTTYVVLFLLFFFVFLIAIAINYFLDWSYILNIDSIYNAELHTVFQLLTCFFCINIVASVFTTMLTADQKPALASLIQTSGQVLALICIYILSKTVPGNFSVLAVAFSGIPCLLLVIVSYVMFCKTNYKAISPSRHYVRFSLTKKIVGMGGQFFLIMISMLFIYQFINIIVSRIEGAEAVTQYNIAYKYFGVLNMSFAIVLTPFWSAFTDAYVKKDYDWMRGMVKKLERTWLLCIPALVLMILCSSFLYQWWIGNLVHISFSLSVTMAVFVLFQTGSGVYITLINGIGKVRLQLMIYLLFAIMAIPLMNQCCALYGTEGVLIIPTIVFFLQTIIGRIQILKIINGTARGIWLQ